MTSLRNMIRQCRSNFMQLQYKNIFTNTFQNNQLISNIKIVRAGGKGMGIGQMKDGKIIMVKNTVPGDIIDCEIIEEKKQYIIGNLKQLNQASLSRVEPKCKHFSECDGCSWQHMNYKQQLIQKNEEIIRNFKNIAKIVIPQQIINEIIASKKIFEYRNKVEFSYQKNTGGYFKEKSDRVINIQNCEIVQQSFNLIHQYILKINEQYLVKRVQIKQSNLNEYLILVQFRDKKSNDLLKNLQQNFPFLQNILFSDSEQKVQLFSGKNYITEQIKHLKFQITSKSFFQTNSEMALEMFEKAIYLCKPTKNQIVYDLYCGTGTFSLFFSNHVERVIGIDADKDSIMMAKENCSINKIDNCTFHQGDVQNILNDNFISQNGSPDIVILDPPFSGIDKHVLHFINKLKTKKILYVSCNSATQARDTKILIKNYQITQMQSIDMFPHTYHSENMILFEITDKNNNIQ